MSRSSRSRHGQNQQASQPKFQHTKLEKPEDEVRLLQVHRYIKGKPVTCTVQSMTRSRAAANNYRALSYQWGNPTPTYPIIVNGRWFDVQENLYNFLKHASRMRRMNANSWTTGFYWIDALCIDQTESDENEERPVQIEHMRRVYEDAYETYIWLGTEDGSTTGALEQLANWVENTLKNRSGDGMSMSEWKVMARATLIVLENPYWTRVWILQEIAVSESMRLDLLSTSI